MAMRLTHLVCPFFCFLYFHEIQCECLFMTSKEQICVSFFLKGATLKVLPLFSRREFSSHSLACR
ncbi:unnamed protein product [Brassica oleracea var. botrytis]